jgi:sulfate adenylyltransferase
MTGVDDPYEPPEHSEIRLDTLGQTPQDSARWVLKELERGGWLSPPL